LLQQCCNNLLVWDNRGELHHAREVESRPTLPKLRNQLLRQRCHNSYTILRPLLLQHIPPNPLADLPVEHRQRRVHRSGHLLPGRGDQFSHIAEQRVLDHCGVSPSRRSFFAALDGRFAFETMACGGAA
jgi:hypothetical protein